MDDVAALRPMKAVTGSLPADDGRWAFEIKWDGMRVLAHVRADGTVKLYSANGKDATGSYPELAALGAAVPGHDVVLDGEVVALDEHGKPSFGRLQQRMHIGSAREAHLRAAETPVVLVLFDLLRIDSVDATPLPYLDRRRLLRELMPAGSAWLIPEHHLSDGGALFEAAREQGLEGVMAKRVDSPYIVGKRSTAWVKVKVRRRQELVVGGWQPGEGNRAGRMGSLLVGHNEGSSLRFAGKVGTGFNDRELTRLDGLLASLEVDEPPFDPPPPRLVARRARWVRPELVAEVEFAEWTSEGILRHPSYLGLRADKAATDVVREG